jgi:hypothetical protein
MGWNQSRYMLSENLFRGITINPLCSFVPTGNDTSRDIVPIASSDDSTIFAKYRILSSAFLLSVIS